MFPNWWRRFVNRLSRVSQARPRKRCCRGPYQPHVEALEDRCLLSVLHTFAYHEITALSTGPNANPWPVLSADGSRAVFTTNPGTGINHVSVINADGTGQQEVDSFPGNLYPGDISADGTQVISVQGLGDGYHIRMVNADGTGEHDIITIYGGYIQDRLSSDGSKVFFTDDRDFSVAAENLTKGLYVINADGTGRSQIVSGDQIGTLLSVPIDNIYVSAGVSLAMTTDYSQIVFGVSSVGVGQYVLGVNFDGSGLHQILFTPVGVSHAGISGDGSKVFYDIPTPEAGVINFDGSGRVVLADHSFPTGYPDGGDPVQISADGSELLMGSTGVMINTTTTATLQLAARGGYFSSDPVPLLYDGMFRATMNSTATRFLYVALDQNLVRQLATLDIDPVDLGAAPLLDNLSIDPSAIVAGGAAATVSATVSTTNTLIRVGNAVLRDGLDDGTVNHVVMLDDGTGIFSTNQISANSNAVPGPRTVRVKAEVLDGSGKRHATAVEFDPFEVIASGGSGGGGAFRFNQGGTLPLDALVFWESSSKLLSSPWSWNGDGVFGHPMAVHPAAAGARLQALGAAERGAPEVAAFLAGASPHVRKPQGDNNTDFWNDYSHEVCEGIIRNRW